LLTEIQLDGRKEIRYPALQVLRAHLDKSNIRACFVAAARDRSRDVRDLVRETLRIYAQKFTLEERVHAFTLAYGRESDRPEVRRQLIKALGELSTELGKDAKGVLFRAANERDPALRECAIRVLGNFFESTDVAPVVVKAAFDSTDRVRQQARLVLERVSPDARLQAVAAWASREPETEAKIRRDP